ncbi:MAG: 50S ribosomal protein L30 [Saprospiraceae bacterium]
MAKVKITQVKSLINRPKRQKDTMKALGLKKINHSVTIDVNPQIQGMINAVTHLVKVEQA